MCVNSPEKLVKEPEENRMTNTKLASKVYEQRTAPLVFRGSGSVLLVALVRISMTMGVRDMLQCHLALWLKNLKNRFLSCTGSCVVSCAPAP